MNQNKTKLQNSWSKIDTNILKPKNRKGNNQKNLNIFKICMARNKDQMVCLSEILDYYQKKCRFPWSDLLLLAVRGTITKKYHIFIYCKLPTNSASFLGCKLQNIPKKKKKVLSIFLRQFFLQRNWRLFEWIRKEDSSFFFFFPLSLTYLLSLSEAKRKAGN